MFTKSPLAKIITIDLNEPADLKLPTVPISVAFTIVACVLSFHQLSLAVLLYILTVPTKWLIALLAGLWPWTRLWFAGQSYKLVNQKRYRRVLHIEDYIQKLKAMRQSDLFLAESWAGTTKEEIYLKECR